MDEEEDQRPQHAAPAAINLPEMMRVLEGVMEGRRIANEIHDRTDPKNQFVREYQVLDAIHKTLELLAFNPEKSREFLRGVHKPYKRSEK